VQLNFFNLSHYFFFLGKPFFILAYALADIVDFFFGRDVPAFLLLLIFAYKLIIPPTFKSYFQKYKMRVLLLVGGF
jgi:hypothetical protein